MLVRLGGKAIRSITIELDGLMDYQEEILRYSFHELNQIEQLYLKSRSKIIPFKYVAYILEKNKDSLCKLTLDLQIEETSLKYFATIILNMHKLKLLHITSATKLQSLHNSQFISSLKHVLSKDSLTSIIIDELPLLDDFSSLLGFS